MPANEVPVPVPVPVPPWDTHYRTEQEIWKRKGNDHGKLVKVLAEMAKDYLTVQASSVASERAFSSGADLVTPDRCSLAGKTIERTQFLKFNLFRE